MRTTARNGFRAYEPTITIDPDDHPAFLTLGEIEHLSYNSVIGELAWPSGKTTEVPTRGNLTSPICRTIFGWDNQTFIKVDAISPEEKAARAKARYEEKKDVGTSHTPG